jgi:hypothetical protein
VAIVHTKMLKKLAIIHLKEGLAKFGYKPDMDLKSLFHLV